MIKYCLIIGHALIFTIYNFFSTNMRDKKNFREKKKPTLLVFLAIKS